MTRRARWLLVVAIIGVAAGVARGQVILSWISLSTLVWFLSEWLRFQARVYGEMPHVGIERRVNGRDELSGTLWAGRKIRIDLRIRGRWRLSPEIRIRDVVPDILEIQPASGQAARPEQSGARGSTGEKAFFMRGLSDARRWFADSGSDPADPASGHEWTLNRRCREQTFSYVARARAAGQVTLPGTRLTFQDQHRFFQRYRFVELSQTFRILPDYYQSGKLRPTVKRHNSLPRQGIHRLQRAGVGSELLELREYAAGDPPKSIAWKVSARRGKLMTRKYESEVPVRVQLFVDGSITTRVGDYGLRLLDQVSYVAASVAKAATSVGDPIGGVLVDEAGARQLGWLSGDRGFLLLLQALADFLYRPPPAVGGVTPYMMQSAFRICHERFPELLERRYNRIPFKLFASSRRRFRLAGVLAQVFQLSPREQAECCYDEATLALHLQGLLHRAGMPLVPPLYSPSRDLDAAGVRGLTRLAEAISRAIANARDNEVFVIFADPLVYSTSLPQLIHVLKLAVAKHHRVAFVCPTTTFMRPTSDPVQPRSNRIEDLLLASEQTRVRELATRMKREVMRLGIAVSFSGEREAIQMVLAEMDMARDGRTRLPGARS